MSLNVKDKACAVCHEEFKETDDVVFCPVCGAAHHRECYLSLGHCGEEEKHGMQEETAPEEDAPAQEPVTEATEESRDAEAETFERKCVNCGETIPEDTRFCPFCGVSAEPVPFAKASFLQLPKIDKNAEIEQGVTAEEVAKVVYLNPFRYITRFISLKGKKRASWNWAALIVPGGWLAYRKMYKQSFAITSLLITTMLFNVPFNIAVSTYLPLTEDGVGFAALFSNYAEYLPSIGILPVVLVFVGAFLRILIHLFTAIYGDFMYKNRVVEVVKQAKSADEPEEFLAKHSGVSFFGFILAFAAMEFLPSLISMLIS